MKYFWSIILLNTFLSLPVNSEDRAKSSPPMSSIIEVKQNFDFVPPLAGTYQLPPIKSAPGGDVIDHNNRKLELGEILDGKISILSFVYLTCTDESGCPLVLSNFFEIYDQSALLPALKNDVQLVTISFDPKRDTVEAINAFQYPISMDSDRFKKIKWTVLTTENDTSVRAILNGYSQALARNKDSDVINHVIRIYLIDKEKKVRNIYGLGTMDPRLLITDIETLLLEKTRQ